MTPAQQWGGRLRNVMSRQGIMSKDLAEVSGIDRSRISEYRRGNALPMLVKARALADALSAPHLAELCVELRTMSCDYCGCDFVDDTRGGHGRLYCSMPCQEAGTSVRTRARRRKEWGTVYTGYRRRIQRYALAVDAFCRSCEWAGICRDAECELRPVSPLPLEREAAA